MTRLFWIGDRVRLRASRSVSAPESSGVYSVTQFLAAAPQPQYRIMSEATGRERLAFESSLELAGADLAATRLQSVG